MFFLKTSIKNLIEILSLGVQLKIVASQEAEVELRVQGLPRLHKKFKTANFM